MKSNNKYQDLISKGKYLDIISEIDALENPSERLKLYKSEALIYEGDFDKALSTFENLLDSNKLEIKIESIRQKSLVHWSLGELAQAESYIEQAVSLASTMDTSQIGNKAIKAHVYHTCGTVYQHRGRLDDAVKYLEKSLEISNETNYKHRIAATTANLAITFAYKGEKWKTIEYYKQALTVFQELGSSSEQALVYGLMGETYWGLGAVKEAINHMELSLEILRGTNNYYRIGDALYVLIDILVTSNSREKAKQYYEELKAINTKTDANNIKYFTKYAEALILKFSNRMKQKAAAQDIFEQLLNEELGFEIWNNVVLHLSDLLLDELRVYSDPEVLRELTKLSDLRYQRAQTQNIKYLEVEALILKGKMELINTNFKTADELFEAAAIIAEEHGHDILVVSANAERKKLEEDIVLWQELLIKGSSIKDRIDQSKIRNYLDQILSINRRELQEEVEESEY